MTDRDLMCVMWPSAGERGRGRASAERERAPAGHAAVSGGRGASTDSTESSQEGHHQVETIL